MLESEEEKEQRLSKQLTRYAANIISTLILLSILWMGASLIELGKNQIAMTGTINLMNSEITHVKELLNHANKELYTQTEADAYKANNLIIRNSLILRLERLENYHSKNG